jgi:hypothetical protein
MKTTQSTLVGIFGALALALSIVPSSQAQCGGLRQLSPTHASLHPQLGPAKLLRTALVTGGDRDRDYNEDDVSIVGLWHVKFISDGINSGLPPGALPKGALADAGYSEWHSDGTEILNSGGRAPVTSSFCLGVWEKQGPREYKLNHFAIAWDPTPVLPDSPNGTILGPANIKELVTLAPDGQSYTGTFSIDQYDEAGNHLVHIEGKITGTRITVNTPPSSIF